ncbi:Predicted oxidoreductase [Gracilibacillus ureilyticus]|uniref:Predicted oxidoreductase n=1 Tax=Gracilibacillus ureilyticus TaxID=531814 RepID=A0A1H9LUH1_9BACI|nr:aldo/keto reductase [Gracilibacillus ureilyticus]SER15086.1 Predicted oxidoreductase [Gracilibacillus ureilyticus]
MLYNNLGKSDLNVSQLSLGCMSLGTDLKKARSIIDAAVDQGINYLDTADLYDQGMNEEIVGEAIKSKRKDIILATKVGNHLKEAGSWFWDPSKDYIKNQVKNSLLRLQTDYIDLYQLHGGTIDDPIEETIEAFEELVKEGVIRYYGISSIRPNVIREYVKKSNIVSVMMQYSIFDRRPEEEILRLLEQNEISVVTRGSLAKGMLSSKALSIISEKAQKGYLNFSQNELTESVKQLSHILEAGQTLNGLAINYVLAEHAVTSVVAGASSNAQLMDNIEAVTQQFRPEQIAEVRQIVKSFRYSQHR